MTANRSQAAMPIPQCLQGCDARARRCAHVRVRVGAGLCVRVCVVLGVRCVGGVCV